MIINTKDKEIPKGFLLQKDYYNSLLLLSRRYNEDKAKINNNTNINIKGKETPILLKSFDHCSINFAQYPSHYPYQNQDLLSIAKAPLSSTTRNKNSQSLSPMKPIKLNRIKRPFPKAYLPNCSSVDFHSNYRTKDIYALKPLDDDSNVTSLNSKKLFYSKKEDNNYKETKSTNTNTFYITSRYDKLICSNFSKVDYFKFSRENMTKRQSKSNNNNNFLRFRNDLKKKMNNKNINHI